MSKIATFFFLIFFSVSISAQYGTEEAKKDLRTLKTGALLLRLPTESTAIAALRKMGQEKEAERRATERRRENREIMFSASRAFSFCPVYFFYAQDSEKIREGKIEDVLFDLDFQRLEKERIPKEYLTAEYGQTPNLGIEGLIIMNSNLIPLEAPFPFYQRKYAVLGIFAISKAKMAENLNQKLWNSWEYWFGEEEK